MRIPLWILCFSISNVSSLVDGGAAVSEPTRVMHPGDFQFSTTTSTLFTLLLSSLLPHPPGTEEMSSERARTHQGRSEGRGKRGRSQQPGESDGDRRARSRPRPRCPEERVPSGLRLGRRIRRSPTARHDAPVPPPGHTAPSRQVLGASPPAPGAGSPRGDRWEDSRRMRDDQRWHSYHPERRLSEVAGQ